MAAAPCWHTVDFAIGPPNFRRDGQRVVAAPVSNRRVVDFGAGELPCRLALLPQPFARAGSHNCAAVKAHTELAVGPTHFTHLLFAGVGRRSVYLYPLPEVQSAFDILRVPSVSARFGTAPDVWNWGMVLMSRLAPKGTYMHA